MRRRRQTSNAEHRTLNSAALRSAARHVGPRLSPAAETKDHLRLPNFKGTLLLDHIAAAEDSRGPFLPINPDCPASARINLPWVFGYLQRCGCQVAPDKRSSDFWLLTCGALRQFVT